MPEINFSAEIKRVGKEIDYLKRNALARRMKLFRSHGIKIVLDVGANTGQYGVQLRSLGWKGHLISFEPVLSAFQRLDHRAKKDPRWSAHHYALGDRNCSLMLNISGDTRSSSLLPMLAPHLKVARYFKTVRRERVEVKTLDQVLPLVAPGEQNLFLKIDAQGYEKRILAGAKKSLSRIGGMQLEMSLRPLYRGEATLDQMLREIQSLGFRLFSLEYGFTDPKSGEMLQVDGIFFREAKSR